MSKENLSRWLAGALAFGAGFAAVVSGAGPTVLSLESVGADIRRDAGAAGWRVVPMGVAPQGVQITRGSLSKVEF